MDGTCALNQAYENVMWEWMGPIFEYLPPNVQLGLGVVLTILGAFAMAFGSILMKYALTDDNEKSRSILSRYSWIIGFCGYNFGAALHFAALAFAPASVLAPMNSLGLVANMITASTILEETFSISDILSTIGMIIGISLCAVATIQPNSEEPVTAVETLIAGLHSWSDSTYLLYILLCLATGSIIYFGITSLELKLDEGRMSPDAADSDASLICKKIGLGSAVLAGLTGAQCILQLKEMVALIYLPEKNGNVLYSLQFWWCLVFFSLAVGLQIYFLNYGLARGDATTVVPAYYVIWTLASTFGGFAKFHEVKQFDWGPGVLFVTGLLLNVIGIIMMAIHEVLTLRSYVEANVPECDLSQMDLISQKKEDEKLGNKVTLSIGLFPFSMVGRAIGRRRFRPLKSKIRRTRSTTSAVEMDGHAEMTYGFGTLSLPPEIYYTRMREANELLS